MDRRGAARSNISGRRREVLASLLLVLAALPPMPSLRAQGPLRQLFCRGGGSARITVDQDPSPRDTANVVVMLTYQRASTKVGNDIRQLAPGTCTWNPLGDTTIPIEPGRVRFDVRREAQPWSATGTRRMDTTVKAAMFFPDPITLPRYFADPSRYWSFFVFEQANFSSSFGAMFESGTPTYVTITGPLVLANDARRDLLCRGGSAGLRFGGGGAVGNNLAKVVLGYRVSATVPGPAGYGLSPGSCAWTDRTAMPTEPGTIAFITARNAQIKQAQSGSIDRSPTAAERYPDVFTIPEYLKDPAHYWSFTVMSRDPDSAIANAVWKRDLTKVVATARADAGSTTRSMPATTGTGSQLFRPGGAGSTTSTSGVFDIRNVVVRTGLEGASILFDAAANITPTVMITPTAGGPAIALTVSGTPRGTLWHYSAAPQKPLARNTPFSYRIDAPATPNARANSASGAFKTLGQYATISISQIDVISDGDTDGNGEWIFDLKSCPASAVGGALYGDFTNLLDWTEGRHAVAIQMANADGNSPDRFKVYVLGMEDDYSTASLSTHLNRPRLACDLSSLGTPGNNGSWEWNYAVLDVDLTKYPGAKGGEAFVRRSAALRNGSTVMFELRGYIEVIRK